MRRPALEDRLDETFGKRLTVISADGGFGKTTLLRLWAADVDASWYEVRPGDGPAAPFARAVVLALEQRVPGLMEELAGALDAGGGARSAERRWSASTAALLCEALDRRLTHDVVLILDDVHELEGAPGAVAFVETLCRGAPSRLHIVLASRAECPFPIARMRGRGEVLEVVGSQLAFDQSEVEELLCSALGEDAVSLAPAVHEATAGWPAAVRLALETLRGLGPGERSDAVEAIARPRGPLFSYLAEEVFGREPAEVRELVRVAAVFDRVSSSLCAALGLAKAGETMTDLARRGLLSPTQGGDEGWFSLHALVRDFAARTWPLTDRERAQVQRRAARWFQSEGVLGEALRSLEAVGDAGALERFLRSHGRAMLPWDAEDVVRAYGRLPHGPYDAELEQLVGDAHYAAGDSLRARVHLERAAEGLDELPPQLAVALARTHYPDGDLNEVIGICARARIDGTDEAAEARALGIWSNAHSMRAEFDQARDVAFRALDSARRSGENDALAFAHHAIALAAHLAGDRRLAHEHYRQERDAAERAGNAHAAARARNNLVADMLACGQAGRALEEHERVIALAEANGLTDFMAMARTLRADILRELGRFDEAIAEFETAAGIVERDGVEFPVGHLIVLADLHRERGDSLLARATYERCAAAAERAENAYHLRRALAGLSRVMVWEDPEEAERLCTRMLALGPDWYDGDAFVAQGWVMLALGRVPDTDRAAADAERVGRERDNPALLAQSLELRALCASDPDAQTALLDEAIAIWRELGSPFKAVRAELAQARLGAGPDAQAAAERAERRLSALGVRLGVRQAAGLLASVPAARPPSVAIIALGQFQVARDGVPVAATEWQSRKARDLLKLLIARRGRPTPREVVMEALWPGEDPGKVAGRLSVALSITRAVLDEHKRFDAQRFLVGDKDAVRLDLANVVVDVESFLREAEAAFELRDAGNADAARERLEYAEALYAGDFLEEDMYADWATPLREQAREAYIRVASALAADANERLDHDAAVRYLLRTLERDPHDERTHLGLVETFLRARRTGEAQRHYRAYVARMDELGVEPAAFPARP